MKIDIISGVQIVGMITGGVKIGGSISISKALCSWSWQSGVIASL